MINSLTSPGELFYSTGMPCELLTPETKTQDKPSGCALSPSLDTCDQVGKNVNPLPVIAPDGQVVLPWGWGAHRPLPGFSHEEIKAQLAESLGECGRATEAEAVTMCGQVFKIGQCTFCLSAPAFPITCDNRLCPDCASRRSEILISEHKDMLRQIRYPKMLSLTFPSVEHLDREWFKWARNCLTKLRHRKVLFGCWQALLSREWEEISGAKIVDIRAVRGDDKWGAVKEVVKYPAKASTFLDNSALVNEFLTATKGLKLTTGFGALYRVQTSRHGSGRMRCPVCGGQDIDFQHGYGFHVSRDRVQKIRGGYVWLKHAPVRAPPILGGVK